MHRTVSNTLQEHVSWQRWADASTPGGKGGKSKYIMIVINARLAFLFLSRFGKCIQKFTDQSMRKSRFALLGRRDALLFFHTLIDALYSICWLDVEFNLLPAILFASFHLLASLQVVSICEKFPEVSALLIFLHEINTTLSFEKICRFWNKIQRCLLREKIL